MFVHLTAVDVKHWSLKCESSKHWKIAECNINKPISSPNNHTETLFKVIVIEYGHHGLLGTLMDAPSLPANVRSTLWSFQSRAGWLILHICPIIHFVMEHLKDIEHFEGWGRTWVWYFQRFVTRGQYFQPVFSYICHWMSVFVIKGVPVVKLVSPTVYGQASQRDHAFNNASGHFEKK